MNLYLSLISGIHAAHFQVNSWSGSLEIGVVDCDPLHFEFPACSSKIQNATWIMSGMSFFKSGNCIIERYGIDLDKLNQDDRIGLMRTSEVKSSLDTLANLLSICFRAI
jgi:hypothetical protein